MSFSSIGIGSIQLILITHVVAVLLGAPALSHVIRTLLFSVYIVSIGFTPVLIALQGDLNEIYTFVVENQLPVARESILSGDRRLLYRNLVWGTMIGAWSGAVAIPLDWDRWWQEWPISCLFTATFGAVIASFFSIAWSCVHRRVKRHHDIE
jgi:GPI ethanolamine phosphate transferase 2/3 subunit F